MCKNIEHGFKQMEDGQGTKPGEGDGPGLPPHPLPQRSGAIGRGFKGADKRQFPVPLVVVQAVTYHEFVRDFKTDVLQRQLNQVPGGLIQKHTYFQALRLSGRKELKEVAQGPAGIYNILNQKYVLAADTHIQVFRHSDNARRFLPGPVAGNGKKVHGYGNGDVSH